MDGADRRHLNQVGPHSGAREGRHHGGEKHSKMSIHRDRGECGSVDGKAGTIHEAGNNDTGSQKTRLCQLSISAPFFYRSLTPLKPIDHSYLVL